jgi:FkbM family methyltransferase
VIKKIILRLGIIKRLYFTRGVRLNGKWIKIPVIKGVSADRTEHWMLDVLKRLAPAYNTAFVDVGVNLGQTLVKTWAVFDNIEYVGFEPNPACVFYAQELVAANKIKNCTIIPAGIANINGLLKLNHYCDYSTDSTASIVDNFRPDEPIQYSQYVPIFDHEVLKEILPSKHKAILKIDVEGAEPEVLEALKPWMEQYQPVILLEVLPVYKPDNTFRLERQQRIEQLMKTLNYHICRIHKEPALSIALLQEIGIHGDLTLCDYLLFPAAEKATIETLFTVKQ